MEAVSRIHNAEVRWRRLLGIFLLLAVVATACGSEPPDIADATDDEVGATDDEVGATDEVPETLALSDFTPEGCINVEEHLAGSDAELHAWWPFDEVYFNDDISEFDTALPLTANTAGVSDNGVVLQGLDLRGQHTYVQAPLQPSGALDFSSESDFSVDMWVRFDAPDDGGTDTPITLFPGGVGTVNATPIGEGAIRSVQRDQLDAAFDLEDQVAEAEASLAETGALPESNLRTTNPEDRFDGSVLIEHGLGEDGGWGIIVYEGTGELEIWHTAENSTTNEIGFKAEHIAEVSELFDGEWHLLAVTWDAVPRVGNENGAVYIDGQQAFLGEFGYSAETSTSTVVTDDVTIGGWSFNGNVLDEWDGWIDEVEIFQGRIPATFIQALYEAGEAGKCKPIPPTEVVCDAWFELEWNSNKSATDNTIIVEDFILRVDQIDGVGNSLAHTTGPPTIQPGNGVPENLHYNPPALAAFPQLYFGQNVLEMDTPSVLGERWSFTGLAGDSSFEAQVQVDKLSKSDLYNWTLTGQVTSTSYIQGTQTQLGTPVTTSLNETGSYTQPNAGQQPTAEILGTFPISCEAEGPPPPPVTCSIETDLADITVGVPVTVLVKNAPPNSTFMWDFGEEQYTTVGQPTQSHTYAVSDGYEIFVEVGDERIECGSIEVPPIDVDPVCSIDPTGTITPNTQVTATAAGLPASATIVWVWGDGAEETTAGALSASHTYGTPGTYEVAIIWQLGNDGGDLRCTGQVIVSEELVECTANFEPSGQLFAGRPFSAGTPAGSAATWDMGDGAFYTTDPITHTYSAPGSYTITIGGNGGETSICEVEVVQFPRVSCQQVRDAEVGEQIAVTVSETPPTNGALEYQVDWDDSTPASTGVAGDFTHTYTAAGNYSIDVSVLIDGDWMLITRCGRDIQVTEDFDFTVACDAQDWPPIGRDVDGDGAVDFQHALGDPGAFTATTNPTNLTGVSYTWAFVDSTGQSTTPNIVGPDATVVVALDPGLWTVTVTAELNGVTRTDTCSGSYGVQG